MKADAVPPQSAASPLTARLPAMTQLRTVPPAARTPYTV